MNQRMGGMYHLILPTHLLVRWFLAGLIFGPEFGSDKFLRNIGSYTDYTALYSMEWKLSY
jgi:hypothetical protein